MLWQQESGRIPLISRHKLNIELIILKVITAIEDEEHMEKTTTTKQKQAIALEYDPQSMAPTVVASGKGAIAERLLRKPGKREFLLIGMISWQIHCPDWKLER